MQSAEYTQTKWQRHGGTGGKHSPPPPSKDHFCKSPKAAEKKLGGVGGSGEATGGLGGDCLTSLKSLKRGWTSLKSPDFLKTITGTRPWSRIPLEGLVLINITLNRVNYSGRLSNNFSSFNQAYAWFKMLKIAYFGFQFFKNFQRRLVRPPLPCLYFLQCWNHLNEILMSTLVLKITAIEKWSVSAWSKCNLAFSSACKQWKRLKNFKNQDKNFSMKTFVLSLFIFVRTYYLEI